MITQDDAINRASEYLRSIGQELPLKAVRRLTAASMPPRLRQKFGDAWVVAFALPQAKGSYSIPSEVTVMILDPSGDIVAGSGM
jgi:hypothetical protein